MTHTVDSELLFHSTGLSKLKARTLQGLEVFVQWLLNGLSLLTVSLSLNIKLIDECFYLQYPIITNKLVSVVRRFRSN